MPERILKYGGVKIRNLVPPVKINRFVKHLPENKRDSLFEIATELRNEGMIKILNDRTPSTIDKDTLNNQITHTKNFRHDIKLKRHMKDTLTLPK